MSGAGLFEELAEQLGPERAVSSGAPRVQEPRRDEPSWQVVDLDALIAHDHPARLVWSFVTSLELGELYASIKACTHTVGRTPIDPRLLLALGTVKTLGVRQPWPSGRRDRLRPRTGGQVRSRACR